MKTLSTRQPLICTFVALAMADCEIDIGSHGVGHLALWGDDVTGTFASPAAGAPVGDGDIEALARCCVEATLRHIEGSSDALGRVSALLDDAMTSLRRSLSAATGAEDHAECRRDLEAAMVALQSEDALAPLLDSARERILQTIDVLRFVVTPRRGETDASGPGGRDRLACEAMAARLRLAVIALDAGIARSGRVRQTRAIVDDSPSIRQVIRDALVSGGRPESRT